MSTSEIVERLQAYRDRAERIMQLFDDRGQVPRPRVAEAQQLFRQLKEELRSEYKRMSTQKAQVRMSELELAFYGPAIADAWANNPSLTGARPDTRPNSKWYDGLYNVSDYMGYWLGRLDDSSQQEQAPSR